jgi:hypothetical protein
MADTTGVSVFNSHNFARNINGVAATNCENRNALKNHLHKSTLELESAN